MWKIRGWKGKCGERAVKLYFSHFSINVKIIQIHLKYTSWVPFLFGKLRCIWQNTSFVPGINMFAFLNNLTLSLNQVLQSWFVLLELVWLTWVLWLRLYLNASCVPSPVGDGREEMRCIRRTQTHPQVRQSRFLGEASIVERDGPRTAGRREVVPSVTCWCFCVVRAFRNFCSG